VGLATGLGVGLATGLGVGLAGGFGVGAAIVGFGSGDAIGSREGVGIASKMGVVIGCNVRVSVASGVGMGDGRTLTGVDSAAGVAPLFLNGVEAASCACTNGAAARKTVAIASRRMMFFRLSPQDRLSQIGS
jgi:hypothetical protein